MSAYDPKRTLDVVLSAIERGLIDGKGNRAVKVRCDGSSGLHHFDNVVGQLSSAGESI
jgi:hypothetical protein